MRNTCQIPGCESAKIAVPGGNVVTIDYAYDPLYRLTKADYSNGNDYAYTYDAVGNRLTASDAQHAFGSQLSVTSYQYDIANRLSSVDGVAYTYDANGNLLNDGTNTYAYDSANRLKTVSREQRVESSYGYNGLGDRLSQNGVNYTLDLNTGLTQVLSDGRTSYTYGLGRISQLSTDTLSTDYFLGDALGSVRQLTSQTGAVTYAALYSPYGEVSQAGGAGFLGYKTTSPPIHGTRVVVGST